MLGRFHPDRLRRILGTVDELLREIDHGIASRAEFIAALPSDRRASAANLAAYLTVRNHDLRELQTELRLLSLSSLGRMEGCVRETLTGVRLCLHGLLGSLPTDRDEQVGVLAGDTADELLAARANELLGPASPGRQTRIMVTLPGGAVEAPDTIRALIAAGMDVARINLAHDDQATWTALAEQVRATAAAMGRTCRIVADLPGPKLRTGELSQGPRVVRVRPQRDELGLVLAPARVVFTDPGNRSGAATGADDVVHVPLTERLARIAAPGDELIVRDTRDRDRAFTVLAVGDHHLLATAEHTVYVGTGCRVALQRGITELCQTTIGELPPVAKALLLAVGDRLAVTRAQVPGQAAEGKQPASIACTMPEVFASIAAGHRILFDDGKIGGIVLANDGDVLDVRIDAVPPKGGRLRAEKGINLPDTGIGAPALGDADRERLDWVARHADLVGMSFVQSPDDVRKLRVELASRGRPHLGVQLKIETARAFQRLPELLFAALEGPPFGVMVARGDLAVEVGYARLAEVQEEILWLCEAAHVPVVWATQVLDSMARTGVPSRAEVTDAAMGVAAECVMLNKGPHIVPTVAFLAGVLARMQAHHVKKRALLRRLHVAVPARAEGRHAGA